MESPGDIERALEKHKQNLGKRWDLLKTASSASHTVVLLGTSRYSSPARASWRRSREAPSVTAALAPGVEVEGEVEEEVEGELLEAVEEDSAAQRTPSARSV